jgi:hypothetical protein
MTSYGNNEEGQGQDEKLVTKPHRCLHAGRAISFAPAISMVEWDTRQRALTSQKIGFDVFEINTLPPQVISGCLFVLFAFT